jgi:hypothetical protein
MERDGWLRWRGMGDQAAEVWVAKSVASLLVRASFLGSNSTVQYKQMKALNFVLLYTVA